MSLVLLGLSLAVSLYGMKVVAGTATEVLAAPTPLVPAPPRAEEERREEGLGHQSDRQQLDSDSWSRGEIRSPREGGGGDVAVFKK